ncbi:MAG TPA: ATP-binding protein [Gaiellaceae bacterium]|nr:ATP-binding protein [Gaiellaceae bacterium]
MRWIRLLLWPAGAVFGIAAEWIFFGWGDPRHWAPDLVTGWTLIACGLVAWSRRPESRSGALMAATGFSWFLGNFATTGVAPVDWVGAHALYVYRGPLVHLLVTYPSGRLSSRLDRAAVAVGYTAALVTPVWRSEIATIVLAFLLVAVCARLYIRAVGPSRRARLLALEAAVGLGLVLAGGAAAHLTVPAGDANDPSLLALEATLCALAGALLAGLLSRAWERASVTDLVVELGESRSGTLRDELARALGDPTLEVGYWLPNAAAFVDSEGRAFALPDPGSERSVTRIEREGQPVAALVHDPAVLEDPGLREAVSSAAQLAAANARLQAEVRAQVAELRASQLRILEAGDEEGRRLERRLHEGAEQRLERLAEQLRRTRLSARTDPARERIDRTEAQLARTLEELRRLAHGLHPRVLVEAGLAGALASLAEQAPVPVEAVAPAAKLPAEVEAVVYFLCAEALANIAKHASASGVSVSVTTGGGRVRVEVEDDGLGGADPARGTGLRGLVDRVEALGGTLRVESPAGRGTRLTAEIPLGDETV